MSHAWDLLISKINTKITFVFRRDELRFQPAALRRRINCAINRHVSSTLYFNPYREVERVICFPISIPKRAHWLEPYTRPIFMLQKTSWLASCVAFPLARTDPHHYYTIRADILFCLISIQHLHIYIIPGCSFFSLFVFIFQTWIQSKSLIYEASIWMELANTAALHTPTTLSI